MSLVMEYNPAAIAAATTSADHKSRLGHNPTFSTVKVDGAPIRRKAPTKAGQLSYATQRRRASPHYTSERAIMAPHPMALSPLAGTTFEPMLHDYGNIAERLADLQNRDAAIPPSQPAPTAPHHDPIPYAPDPTLQPVIDDLRDAHRQRQNIIRAKTRIELQAQATIRLPAMSDNDFADDEAKAKARERIAKLYGEIKKAGPDHPLHANIAVFQDAIALFEAQQAIYEKRMVKLARQLPAYAWAKSVKGLGDISFATLVGECGDIGSYKSVSAVWKRLGLAVMDGKRQGAPGEGASAEDWIAHGYSGKRRSVSWNARNQIIGGMGLWRPMFGEDVRANEELTEYQRVFAERARYEADKLGVPIKCSDKGKESYSKHVINRAMRYTEKRMLKHLYLAWRRGGAL